VSAGREAAPGDRDRARVLIVGCGAIGGIYAARLARVADVCVLDVWREHVETIRARGLRLVVRTEDVAETLTAYPSAAAEPAALPPGPWSHALVAVKGPETRAALRGLASRLGGAIVLTIQNGLGNAETIAAACDAPVCQGVTMNAGEAAGPGEILQTEIGRTWLGPHRASLEEARAWGALLRRAGMAADVLEDPRGAVWAKLIFNSAVNPLPVLTGLRLSEVYADPHTYALLRTLVEEGTAVAAALGISLPHDPMAVIDAHRALGSAHAHVGSMKQDIDRGRPTEIETLTGAIVAAADRAGVPAPALRTVYRLVKAIEARRATSAGAPVPP